MSRKKECVLVFAGAAVFAYGLYALTLPEGLPWGVDGTLSSAWMIVAVATGLLGALVTRYLGWRCGVAVALIFTCVPNVWNRTILGDRTMAFVACALCGLWLLNTLFLWVFRKARKVRHAVPAAGAATVHDETEKRAKINGIAAWIFLGIAALYAIVSITRHDYKMGESASVFAKGIVEEAGERIVVLNGALDEQVVREVERRGGGGGGGGQRNLSTVSLRGDDAYRTNLVARVRREWPGETNLYLAAQVSVAAFLEVALKAHPERFYRMNGQSTTLAGWEKRWEAFEPYLRSRDSFVPVARRMFGYEGNAVGNAMLDADGEVEKAGGGGERNLTSFSAAWRLYKRIYTEIDPGNASALINLNEMIRRGYTVSGDEKKWVTDKVDAFFKDETNCRYIREIAKVCGPVRADPVVAERLKKEAAKQTQERMAAGEKIELPTEIREILEQNDKMVDAMMKDDRETAAKIARVILSKPGWRTWGPANAVMGGIMSDAGDFAAAEVFYALAIANVKETPDVVLNNYADTLMRLGKLGEAERILRELIAKRGETAWPACFTLAEVLSRKAKQSGEEDNFASVKKDVRYLVSSVFKHAPANIKQLMREKQRKGEILK